jgi:hypothetical protein
VELVGLRDISLLILRGRSTRRWWAASKRAYDDSCLVRCLEDLSGYDLRMVEA